MYVCMYVCIIYTHICVFHNKDMKYCSRNLEAVPILGVSTPTPLNVHPLYIYP